MSHVPVQPLGNTAMSPAPICTGSPPSGVTVIRPATTWITSWVASSQREGPGAHCQMPAD